MSAEVIESRLRRLLFFIVILIFIGTLIELFLNEHDESFTQKIPAYLSLLGSVTVAWAYIRPNKWSIYMLRLVMLVIGAGGMYGVYQHFNSNLAFELEIRPNATPKEVWLDALLGGIPLLAPGIVSLAALLSFVATYYHPAITGRRISH